MTPFIFIAAQEGHLEIVRLLLEHGANINAATNDGATALYIAAQKGHLEIVRLLLQQPGIQINAALNTGATALFIAAQKGHIEIVRLLLKAGADPTIKWEDKTPFDAAENPELKKILLAATLTRELDKILTEMIDAKAEPKQTRFWSLFQPNKFTKEDLPAMQKFITYLNGNLDSKEFPDIKNSLAKTPWAKYCKTVESLDKQIAQTKKESKPASIKPAKT